jgi:hypothetical protein
MAYALYPPAGAATHAAALLLSLTIAGATLAALGGQTPARPLEVV